mgnify:CR=1
MNLPNRRIAPLVVGAVAFLATGCALPSHPDPMEVGMRLDDGVITVAVPLCAGPVQEIRLVGRTRLQYRDALGGLDIFAEPMSEPWSDIVVDITSIPDMPGRPSEEVVDRLQRAFRYAGWTLIESGPNGPDGDG